MVSVLVGVAVAAGGHLLWLRPPGGESPVALPGRSADDPLNGSIRRSGPNPASSAPVTESTSAAPTQPSSTTTSPETRQPAPANGQTTRSPTPDSSSASESSNPPRSPRSPHSPPNRPAPTTSDPESSSQSPRTESSSGGNSPSSTARVVDLVNDERADVGCAAVTVDSRLTRAAQRHSDDMAEREYLSHTSPDGTTFDERIRDEGHPRPAAENIAMGLSSPEAVMDAWMSSDGHRRNILNCDITTIGVGVNSDGWYWTQNFGY